MNYKNKKSAIKIRKEIIRLLQITFGTALMAASVDLFLLPNQLSSGGFSGIGTILFYLFDLSMGTTILILNVPLFIISLLKDGKKFFINALLGTALLSLFLNLFQNLNPLTNDKFLACIFGGIIDGIGGAIVLKANSSTGGTDLLAQIIKRFIPKIKISSTIIFLDGIIIIGNIIVFKQFEIGLYSAITIYIIGKILDIFFEGINFSKMFLIVSMKSEEISKKINSEIRRGTTALYGKGMYKNEEKNILMCVVSRNEVWKIMKIIKEVDKNAFTVITDAREVYGKGFK